MTAKRPPYQLELALPMPGQGEAPHRDAQEVEAVTAAAEPESPASTEHLMEAICDWDNIETALRAVVRDKGAPGVDGITVQQLPGILKARWSETAPAIALGADPTRAFSSATARAETSALRPPVTGTSSVNLRS
jgi:RNA-directed DNA polymerase